MSSPTISVVIPVYNGENYLRMALESVLAQTFQDFEIIVIDDGSKDSTPDIAHSFGDRVRYVRQENAGVAAAVNHGISLARGRYFAWLSHDDLWDPEKLSEQLRALQSVDGPAVCYTDIKLIDGEGKVFDEKEAPLPERHSILRAVIRGEPVLFAAYSLVCELRCFEQVGLYDFEKRHTQDADMLMRLARTFPFVRVPEETHVRQGPRHARLQASDLRGGSHRILSRVARLVDTRGAFCESLRVRPRYVAQGVGRRISGAPHGTVDGTGACAIPEGSR